MKSASFQLFLYKLISAQTFNCTWLQCMCILKARVVSKNAGIILCLTSKVNPLVAQEDVQARLERLTKRPAVCPFSCWHGSGL